MILLLAFVLLLATPAGEPPVKFFSAKDVEGRLPKSPVTLDKSDKYTVMVNKRTAAGEAEVHEIDTDVFYVVDGSAMFVTGGTVVGSHLTTPGEIRGKNIKGGQTHHLSKGDIMTIPAGTPHWFSDVHSPMTYLIVKVATKGK